MDIKLEASEFEKLYDALVGAYDHIENELYRHRNGLSTIMSSRAQAEKHKKLVEESMRIMGDKGMKLLNPDLQYCHTPEMGEISGMGGSYENGCQIMLNAGVEWLNEHKDADLQAHGYNNVYGLFIEDNDITKKLGDHIVAAVNKWNPDCGVSGAMHQAVMTNLFYVKEHGWDKYVELWTRGRKEDSNK